MIEVIPDDIPKQGQHMGSAKHLLIVRSSRPNTPVNAYLQWKKIEIYVYLFIWIFI